MKVNKYINVNPGTKLARGESTWAAMDIKPGTRIIEEPPVLRFESYPDPYDLYLQFLDKREDVQSKILRLSARPSLERHYLERIKEPDLAVLYNLCQQPDRPKASIAEAAKVWAIFHDNQVQCQYKARAEVAIQVARINHSCVPNVAVSWNPTLVKNTGRYVVHALRHIKKGEEICYSYVYIPEPREQRQERLKRRWGIDCKCSVCDFESMDMDAQKQTIIAETKVMRPALKRLSTGELNRMLWWDPPDLLGTEDDAGERAARASENRRQAWRKNNESTNKTRYEEESFGRAATYESMINMLGKANGHEEMMEERVRLYRELIREYDPLYDEEGRHSVRLAECYREAIEFATICYGADAEMTIQMRKFMTTMPDDYRVQRFS